MPQYLDYRREKYVVRPKHREILEQDSKEMSVYYVRRQLETSLGMRTVINNVILKYLLLPHIVIFASILKLSLIK